MKSKNQHYILGLLVYILVSNSIEGGLGVIASVVLAYIISIVAEVLALREESQNL
jgi:hypothetical protein